jgi:cytochrome c oxidase subunit II
MKRVIGAVGAAVLGAAAIYAGMALAIAMASTEPVVRIEASKFRYDPPVLTLKRGEPVVLELTSSDRSHGFKLPELGIDVKILPGETTQIRVLPDKAGKFFFACDVFCGSGHEEMEGEIVVTE